ncbi:MAG TPA: sulfatase-like hydrolase/transferase [Acidobacteriaceae bacterium]|nr:sulfatase-like hydrolase/transferase [Acidobacteriaceae bacterium]
MTDQKITRRGFLGSSGAAMLAGLTTQVAAGSSAGEPAPAQAVPDRPESPSRSRPNLVLFMPDELRADALGCYGNPLTRTPNFDKLAQEGTRFPNCHVQYPVCGASRCSLLSGWPASVRGHRSLFYFLRPDEPNLFRYLRQAGYDVFWYGKNDALAAESFYQSVSMWNYPEPAPATRNAPAPAPEIAGPDTFIGRSKGDRRTTPEYGLIQAAIRILERKETDRPFCIFLPLISPHPPYASPEGFNEMYSPADIQGLRPRDLPNRPNYIPAIRKAYGLDGLPEDTYRKVRAFYYGAVSYSDWLLGELLEAVERTNHKGDTAVFVLSDHGDYAGDYGLVEKWPSGLEDALTHVPLIARVPGGAHGNAAEEMVELFDVMATCLELAGTQAQHTHFARSLMPQIHGGPGDPKRAAFAEGGYNQYEPQCFEDNEHTPGPLYYPKEHLETSQPETVSRAAMIRTREYKLISRPQGQSELYIYKDDPQELNNRFADRDVASTRCELLERLLHWYVNTTGIAPFDKDQRGFPPYYPTPALPLSIPSAVREIIDRD